MTPAPKTKAKRKALALTVRNEMASYRRAADGEGHGTAALERARVAMAEILALEGML